MALGILCAPLILTEEHFRTCLAIYILSPKLHGARVDVLR
jgi:hypothetical protein